MAARGEHKLPAREAGATRMLGSAGMAASHGHRLGAREPLVLPASRRLVPQRTLLRGPNWGIGHPVCVSVGGGQGEMMSKPSCEATFLLRKFLLQSVNTQERGARGRNTDPASGGTAGPWLGPFAVRLQGNQLPPPPRPPPRVLGKGSKVI